MNDMEVLRRAYEIENGPKAPRLGITGTWEFYAVGASREDIKRLLDEGLVTISSKNSVMTKYRLSEKGKKLVWATNMENEMEKIPAESVLEAMSLIIGFEDIKQEIARAVEKRKRIHFLLEGPPACAKSLMLEGVRAAVPRAYLAFGSRTSSSGLSDALFEYRPEVLLLDETDKMHNDCYSVLLGLMEGGEIIETKSQKTRGIKLQTMVIAACNSSKEMPREFKSRFGLHVHFPEYSRQEFIDVCVGFLSRAEGAPPDIARILGEKIFDYGIGDVRKARSALLLMDEYTEAEAMRKIQLMLKYGAEAAARHSKDAPRIRLPGI